MSAHYEIYSDQLSSYRLGHALWEPRPDPTPVGVGDVGYMLRGGFQRLFNIHLPRDHPSHQRLGVPEYFEPLTLDPSRLCTRPVRPRHLCSRSVRAVGVGAEVAGPAALAGGQLSFSTSRQQGAVLVQPHAGQSQDSSMIGLYEMYIREHCDRWQAFAERHGFGIRLEDIIFVTGHDMTSSWAMAAFTSAEVEGSASLTVSFGSVGSLSASSHMTWSHLQHAISNWGPQTDFLPSTAETSSTSGFDQCVFIRGFHMKRRRILFPKKLKAFAEVPYERRGDPDNDGTTGSSPQSSNDEGMELDLEYLGGQPEHRALYSPLHEYILEDPSIDLAIIHDDDVAPFLEGDTDANGVAAQLAMMRPQITRIEHSGADFHSSKEEPSRAGRILMPDVFATVEPRGIPNSSSQSADSTPAGFPYTSRASSNDTLVGTYDTDASIKNPEPGWFPGYLPESSPWKGPSLPQIEASLVTWPERQDQLTTLKRDSSLLNAAATTDSLGAPRTLRRYDSTGAHQSYLETKPSSPKTSDREGALLERSQDDTVMLDIPVPLVPRRLRFKMSPLGIFALGLITPYDAHRMFILFYRRINPYICLLDPVLHTPVSTHARSPILFAVVCAIASRYTKPEIYYALMHFAQNAAIRALINGRQSVELCQAFILMSLYSVPDDHVEQDISALYADVAIGLAPSLNAYRSGIKAVIEECENINWTRTRMISSTLDVSTAMQLRRATHFKDRSWDISVDWYKTSAYNRRYDIFVVAHTFLARIVRNFHRAFTSPGIRPGTNRSIEIRAVTNEYVQQLLKCQVEWVGKFGSDFDPTENSIFRCNLWTFHVNHSKLLVLSVGFQKAFEYGLIPDDQDLFTMTFNAAKSVILTLVKSFAPMGYLRFAPDTTFHSAYFAAAILLKLLRPECSQFSTETLDAEIFDILRLLVMTIGSDDIAVDARHSSKHYSHFMAGIVSMCMSVLEPGEASTISVPMDTNVVGPIACSRSYDQVFAAMTTWR